MSAPKFIISGKDLSKKVDNGTVLLDPENYHHLKNVLRLAPGSRVHVVDLIKLELLTCKLTQVEKSAITAKIEKTKNLPQLSPPNLNLHIAISKPKVVDFLVEKSVELGANKVNFYLAERSQNHDSELEKKRKRFEKIIEGAIKQSASPVWPEISFQKSLIESLETIKGDRYKVLLTGPNEKDAKTVSFLGYLNKLKQELGEGFEKSHNNVDLSLIFGPEGGLSETELELAAKHQCQFSTLSKNILRVETAAVLAAGVVRIVF